LVVHAAIAAWYADKPISECYEVLTEAADKHDMAGEDALNFSKGIFEHYISYYVNDKTDFEPLLIETKISEPSVGLKCIADIVLRHRRTGKVYIFDHKVLASLDICKAFDTQKIANYLVLAERYPIDGFVFNLLRRRLPAVLEPLKNGRRLKKFMPNSTTGTMFEQACTKYGFKMADYPDAINYYRTHPNPFFHREPVDITAEEMKEFLEEVDTVRNEMASGVIYKNRQWDCDRWCDYYEDCFKLDKTSPKIISKEG
jgi:hypothetical protein